MADGFVHTVYKNDQWVNEIEGNGSVGSSRRMKKLSQPAVSRLSRTRPST
jgi:hypothetical protein